jgi:hypothetical protein
MSRIERYFYFWKMGIEKRTVATLLDERSEMNQETRETLKLIQENLRELDEMFQEGLISRGVYDYHKDKILNYYIIH